MFHQWINSYTSEYNFRIDTNLFHHFNDCNMDDTFTVIGKAWNKCVLRRVSRMWDGGLRLSRTVSPGLSLFDQRVR